MLASELGHVSLLVQVQPRYRLSHQGVGGRVERGGHEVGQVPVTAPDAGAT
jgi:hypothetical protein